MSDDPALIADYVRDEEFVLAAALIWEPIVEPMLAPEVREMVKRVLARIEGQGWRLIDGEVS